MRKGWLGFGNYARRYLTGQRTTTDSSESFVQDVLAGWHATHFTLQFHLSQNNPMSLLWSVSRKFKRIASQWNCVVLKAWPHWKELTFVSNYFPRKKNTHWFEALGMKKYPSVKFHEVVSGVPIPTLGKQKPHFEKWCCKHYACIHVCRTYISFSYSPQFLQPYLDRTWRRRSSNSLTSNATGLLCLTGHVSCSSHTRFGAHKYHCLIFMDIFY
jgi:hypothetical protein